MAKSFTGTFYMNEMYAEVRFNQYLQGTEITRFPAGGYLYTQSLYEPVLKRHKLTAILGLFTLEQENPSRIVIFGDSSCFDVDITPNNCLWLLDPLLKFTSSGYLDSAFFPSDLQLPFDYDIHLEIQNPTNSLFPPAIDSSRLSYLQCDSSTKELVYEPYHHNPSKRKIREWGKQGMSVKASDLVVIIERGVFIILLVMIATVVIFRRSRRPNQRQSLIALRKKPERNTLPLSISV